MGGIRFLGLVLVFALIAGKGRTEQQRNDEEHDQVSAGSENTYQATTEPVLQVVQSAERRMSLEDFFLNRNQQPQQPQQPEAPQVQEVPLTQFQVQQPNPNSVLLVRDTQFPNPRGGLLSRILLARRMLRLRRIARRLAIVPRMLRLGQQLRQARQPLGLFSNRVGETYQQPYDPRDYVFGKNGFSYSNNASGSQQNYNADQQQQQSRGYALEAEPYYDPANDAPYELYDDHSNIRGIDSYENDDLSLNLQNPNLNTINTNFANNGPNALQGLDTDRLNQQLLLQIQQLQKYQQLLQQQQPLLQQNDQQVHNENQQNLHQQQLLNQQQNLHQQQLLNPQQNLHQQKLLNQQQNLHQQQLLNQQQSHTLNNPVQPHQQPSLTLNNPRDHQQPLNHYQGSQADNVQQNVQDQQSQLAHEQQLQLLRDQQLQLEREQQLRQQLLKLQELQAQQALFQQQQQQQQQQNIQPNQAISNEQPQNYQQHQIGQQQNVDPQQSTPSAHRNLNNDFGSSLVIENSGSNNIGTSANIIGVGVNVGIKPPAVDVQVTKPVSPIIQPLPPIVNPIAPKPVPAAPAPVEEPLVPIGILPKPILNLKGRVFFGAEVGKGVNVKTGAGR
ncbi:bromodomain-containing protein DDB_G0280777-like [Stegodyphus dumicola]|uniref:bromodomain-containing protein DDB_G0280777-like n=1 Tax=Stegodyphus dumicola TaxID=202533 RepID=UPI0015B01C84|nr:bromodomain-containing protein DDB_G0280777-like [Stegodyphus dumicola]